LRNAASARRFVYGRGSSAVAEEEAGEAREDAAEEMRGEDRAEDAEEKIEDRAHARRVGEERDVAKDGLRAKIEAPVHQVDREEHVVKPRRQPPRRHSQCIVTTMTAQTNFMKLMRRLVSEVMVEQNYMA
jgi:hypothetical protein